ncbi:protoporphyrinogen oxidase [Gordonia rhizosphera]|uniref:Coproporphyrinogen III oxidase n=1 Tax=Gordonia rhizosphera NBRC 16068 TaxID=1108045 RepID=K6WZW0_9ACTN|nr:protoporphyrinogen oxidase [Gordonia rhizosphera]GAB92099.1 protoporphyrinogen oxidase [Gordonia rhizosphera NBRC 16068]
MSVRVTVVGGGVSGLTAAYRLRQALGPDAQIDLYEADDRLGGILYTRTVGDRAVDVGAEAFIVRRPEALDLVTELGLADRVVSPTNRRPAVWAGGRLHPLPAPALMGIPACPEAVAGLADPRDVQRIATEPDRPWRWDPGADPSVGELVADRFGPSVVARSVDPMLGGVYSSLADDIGLREALPALAVRLDAGAAGLTAAVGELTSAGAGGGPVFGTLVGGYRVLVDALVDAARIVPRRSRRVVGLAARPGGWTVDVAGVGTTDYDGVVVALPAPQAALLLRGVAPDIAAPLAAVQPASSLVVSIALAPGTPLPDHSGVLVATGEDLRAKAFTFSSQKWAHLSGGGSVSVRASFGRYGAPVPDDTAEPAVEDRIRTEALEDLDEVCRAAGVPAPSGRVTDLVVQRWTGGLPVYAPGHLAVMDDLLGVHPARLALVGSTYAGVGVPACIGHAGRAVTALVADLT